MRAKGVMSHELLRDLPRERGIEATADVNRRQLRVLPLVVGAKFSAFTMKIGLFGVCLRVHGHVLASSHRHGTGDKAGDACDQYAAAAAMRGGNTQHQTGCRKDAIIGAQYGGAQPSALLCAMSFSMVYWHAGWCLHCARWRTA